MHQKADVKIEILSWICIIIFFFFAVSFTRKKISIALHEKPSVEEILEESDFDSDDAQQEEILVQDKEPELALQEPQTEPLAPSIQSEPEPVNLPKPAPQSSGRNFRLYFMAVNEDGSISRIEISRTMPKTTSPLRASVEALLAGPTPDERASGCRSLIADGTRLIGASVKDGVATLNFNDKFEFNSLGVQGLIGQLEQIVYTATEFSTVNSVQFLVEGQQREYLGSDGVWIGSPLSRNKF